jgi:glucosyl-3-phosphoglycerate synthase
MATVDSSARDEASNERAKARTFHHSAYTPERVAAARARSGLSVSVCLPARECAGTVGEIVRALGALRDAGTLDRVVVVDAASPDGTAELAARAGAEVWQQDELLPSFGAVLGKGDAMWRALSALDSDVVCFLDADSEHFSAHFATGLLGALLCEPDVSFVKAFYRRPFARTDASAEAAALAREPAAGVANRDPAAGVADRDPAGGVADGEAAAEREGGRVNHLLARPALALFYPQLAQIRQPLAGEVAARGELLRRLPFATGYGVEIAMLIDAWRAVGLGGVAQVDLEEHHNRHQALSALSPMALTVLATIARRLEQEGRLAGDVAAAHAPPERPPLASLAELSAGGGMGI